MIIQKTKKSAGGYGLVEILVSIGIFMVVVAVVVGGFIRGWRADRQAIALVSANSNVAAAIEQMMREMRTSSSFDFMGCPGPPYDCINFVTSPPESLRVTYKLDNNRILRGIDNGGSIDFSQITDDNVTVDYLNFIRLIRDGYPVRVIIRLGIKANEEGAREGIINIQTTVSARN